MLRRVGVAQRESCGASSWNATAARSRKARRISADQGTRLRGGQPQPPTHDALSGTGPLRGHRRAANDAENALSSDPRLRGRVGVGASARSSGGPVERDHRSFAFRPRAGRDRSSLHLLSFQVCERSVGLPIGQVTDRHVIRSHAALGRAPAGVALSLSGP